jgi:hypothetical protein
MLNLPVPETMKEAWLQLAGSIVFFLSNKRAFVSVPIIIGILTYSVPKVEAYFASEQVVIKKAKPPAREEEDEGSLFSFSSVAYAGKPSKPCADSIVIDNVFWGCNDTTFHLFVVQGTDKIIIHDHKTEETTETELPLLKAREEFYQQQQKGKK